MKKITDLVADDFPGVDAEKFKEWKIFQEKLSKWSSIMTPVSILIIIFIIVDTGILSALLFGLALIVALVYEMPLRIKISKLQKAAGITSKDIKKARNK